MLFLCILVLISLHTLPLKKKRFCIIFVYVHVCDYVHTYIHRGVETGNIEPTAGHFGLFSPLLSCSPYTLYTVQFCFTGHSLDLSDNVLHDWLFPHHCIYIYTYIHTHTHTHTYIHTCIQHTCAVHSYIHRILFREVGAFAANPTPPLELIWQYAYHEGLYIHVHTYIVHTYIHVYIIYTYIHTHCTK